MIRLHGISKCYSGGRWALRDVHLHVREGEFAVLTGPSGAGKSSLLRMLRADEAPDEGTAIIGGRNLARLDRAGLSELRRSLGLVFDDPRLIGRMSALDNVALAAEVAGETRAEARRLAHAALETVGIDKLSGLRPERLSKGQGQLVSLARALVNSPSLILADEPLLHLDPDHTQAILRVLVDASRRGATVLMASHNLAALSSVPCRVVMIAGGRLFEDDDSAAFAAL